MEISKLIDKEKIKTVRVSFSGGKDSIACLLWAIDYFGKNKIQVWNVHNILEWNDIFEYFKYLEGKLDVKINIKTFSNEHFEKFKKGIESNTTHIGVPLISRYCQSLAKGNLFKKIPKTDIVIEGVRWAESTQRMNKRIIEEKDGRKILRPIISWSDKEVYEYIKKNKIKLHWVYKYIDRFGCALCPLAFLKKRAIIPFLAKKMQNKFESELYKWWFDLIIKNGLKKANGRKNIIENYNKFKKNYNLYKIIDPEKVSLPIRDIPNYGFWEN